MPCCGAAAKWKREVVHDHKFDFIDVNAFYENSLLRKLKYSFVILLAIKSTLVYIADLWTAGILLFFNNWQTIQPKIPLDVARYIYLLCILCSFLLLGWDSLGAWKTIKSSDIGLAYTNPIAYRIYVLRSYAHYCFFSQINNSKKISDDVAFFVFFTLKGWKRIIFAEAPRQVVNGFTIYAILTDNPRKIVDLTGVYAKADLENNPIPFLALCLMVFTFVVFVISAVLMMVASILYIPLLCHMQGNLKEYCCHKIDKRIGEMLKKKSRRRLAREARREMARALEKGAADSQTGPTLPSLPDLAHDDAVSEYGFPAAQNGAWRSQAAYSEYSNSPYMGPTRSRRPSAAPYDDAGSEYGFPAAQNDARRPQAAYSEYSNSPYMGPTRSRRPSAAPHDDAGSEYGFPAAQNGARRPQAAYSDYPNSPYMGPSLSTRPSVAPHDDAGSEYGFPAAQNGARRPQAAYSDYPNSPYMGPSLSKRPSAAPRPRYAPTRHHLVTPHARPAQPPHYPSSVPSSPISAYMQAYGNPQAPP